MQEININSNITLKYIPMTKLKTTTIGVFLHRPLNKEQATMNAILPYVLRRGCKLCKDTEEISKYLENLYGSSMSGTVIKRGEDQIIYFDAETISDKYAANGEALTEDLIKLLLSVLFEPNAENDAFDEEILNQEKNNAKDRILSIMNDKRSYASIRCIEEMCEGESFSIYQLGKAEDIDNIGAKSLYAYYKSIISSSPIDIYVCGDADIEKIKAVVESYVGEMEFTTPILPQTTILKKSTEVKNVTEKMDVAQGKLAIGFRTNIKPTDADFPALTVMNSVFGAGAHSKLFNNVREKLSLAYYASTQLEKFKGLLIINAGIEFKNFQKAYDESLLQLEEIKKGNISELEYTSSINAILNSLEGFYDDQRMLENFYLGEHITGTNRDIEQVKEQVKKVTIEDIQKVAEKLELDTIYFLKGRED